MSRLSWALGVLLLAACVRPGRGAESEDPADIPAVDSLGGRVTFTLDLGVHGGNITRVLFTPDGRQLVTVGADHSVRIWDTDTWQTRKVIYPPGLGVPWAGALSPDGRRLAVSSICLEKDRKVFVVHLFALPDGRLERTLRGHSAPILGLAFSPDGTRLASAGGADRTTRVWDLTGQDGPRVIAAPPGTRLLADHAFSPDGRLLARVRENKERVRLCQVIEVATGKEVAGGLEGGPVAWSPDGKTLAAGGKSLHLYEPDGTLRARVREKIDMNTVAFGADSETVLGVWTSEGYPHAGLFDTADGRLRTKFAPTGTGARAGALSPDGRLAVTADWEGAHALFVWRTADSKLVKQLALPRWLPFPAQAGWSADGRSVTWHFNPKNPHGRQSFHLGLLQFGEGLPEEDFRGPTRQDGDLSLEPEGHTSIRVVKNGERMAILKGVFPGSASLLGKGRVAAGSHDPPWAIVLLDAATGKEVRRLRGHFDRVRTLVPSPDGGRYLLSTSADQTLRIWDPQQDRPLLSLYVRGRDWVMWTEEGYYASSPGGERMVGWKVDNGTEQAAGFYTARQFRASLYRPDVISRVLSEGSVAKALKAADAARGVMESKPAAVEEVLPPQVTLSARGVKDGKVMAPTVEVEATARGAGKHPVTALQLLLDGRPYQGAKGLRRVEAGKGGAAVTEKWTVELPEGEHTLRVLARTDASMGLSNDLEIDYALPPPRPKLYVLAVGIDTYKDKNLKLHCAVHDAVELEKTFRSRSKDLYEVESQVLTDARAGKQAILEEGLGWLKKNMKPQDVAVVFYAGHGEQDRTGFYLLPQDVDVSRLADTAVSGEELKQHLTDLPGKVLLLLDACHSGRVGKAINDIARDLADEDCGVVVMCAALGSETAGEADGHGFFCQALIEGLGGKAGKNARDGRVYLHHLEQYVIDRVEELSKDSQHPTTAKPTIRSFALARP